MAGCMASFVPTDFFQQTIDLLEKAYVRGECSASEYTSECRGLIAQFKTAQNLLPEEAQNVEMFANEVRFPFHSIHPQPIATEI